MTETYYDVLGVSEEASTDEIEAAYRERLKETHPDVSDDDDARKSTQAIIEARDVLVDEDERARYDDIGHAAYVGTGEPNVESESNAAAAARRAGYGQPSSDAGETAPESDQSSDRQRRADRERRARERVSQERVRNRQRTGSRRTTETTASTASGTTSSGTAQQGSTTATQYSVRQEYDVVEKPEDLLPSGRALTVFGLAFSFYPVLLASAVFPQFPLTVNILVGLCAVFVFGYLQSMPRIAVMVFGGWSLIAPLLLLVLPYGIFSIVGIFTLCGTWLPFGFSVLTLSILRSGTP